ncbi:hypothetical protein WDW37_01050 [Bdellovibrionota bacterium FG-1]
MPTRGDVYFPKTILPPHSQNTHRCVVLSAPPQGAANDLFVMVAIIRSRNHQNGKPVSLVLGHSIPLAKRDCPWLHHDSILETHQLFALPEREFQTLTPLGAMPSDKLYEALAGARRLFT